MYRCATCGHQRLHHNKGLEACSLCLCGYYEHPMFNLKPVEQEENYGPRICRLCKNMLVWMDDRLPLPGYIWKLYPLNERILPEQCSGHKFVTMDVVTKEIDEIERRWR